MGDCDAIRHEIVYPFPINAVWDALTDSDQLAIWLMKNDFAGQVGQTFMFYDHEPWPDGRIYDNACQVVSFDPPYRLAYTWSSLPKHGSALVEWELFPVSSGPRVKLIHRGFSGHGEAGNEARDFLRDGWRGLLREELLEHLHRAVHMQTGSTQILL